MDVHTIQIHMNSELDHGKNELIFDDITLEPGTLMTVFHCSVPGCDKRNYLDAKSVKTHCRRFHSMNEIDPISTQTEAQFICQVRGCRKLFVETVQIEAHLKVSLFFFMKYFYVDFYSAILRDLEKILVQGVSK